MTEPELTSKEFAAVLVSTMVGRRFREAMRRQGLPELVYDHLGEIVEREAFGVLSMWLTEQSPLEAFIEIEQLEGVLEGS